MLRPSAFILRRERVAVNRLSNRPEQPTGERAGRENTEEFRVGSHGDSGTRPFRRVSDQPRCEFPALEAAQEFHHGLLDGIDLGGG